MSDFHFHQLFQLKNLMTPNKKIENYIQEKENGEDGNVINKETKVDLLSVWDSDSKESLRIDLWTKDMPVEDIWGISINWCKSSATFEGFSLPTYISSIYVLLSNE